MTSKYRAMSHLWRVRKTSSAAFIVIIPEGGNVPDAAATEAPIVSPYHQAINASLFKGDSPFRSGENHSYILYALWAAIGRRVWQYILLIVTNRWRYLHTSDDNTSSGWMRLKLSFKGTKSEVVVWIWVRLSLKDTALFSYWFSNRIPVRINGLIGSLATFQSFCLAQTELASLSRSKST